MFHAWASTSSQAAFIAANITYDVIGVSHGVYTMPEVTVFLREGVRPLNGGLRVSKTMMLQLAQSLWQYGFRIRSDAAECIYYTKGLLCDVETFRSLRSEKAVPACWFGWEFISTMVNMSDHMVPPLPDRTIKQSPFGGYPYEPRVEERDHGVRLARAVAPICEYPYLGDGGAHYSANYYSQVADVTRSWWKKPTNRNLPGGTHEEETDVYSKTSLNLIVPGQFPSFDAGNNQQLSWGLVWDGGVDHKMKDVTFQVPNKTDTYTFEFPYGNIAEDPTKCIMLMTELLDAFANVQEVVVRPAPIFALEPSVIADDPGAMGPSAPGNDPRVGSDGWIRIGDRSKSSYNKRAQKVMGNESVPTHNPYDVLPVSRPKRSKAQVERESDLTTAAKVLSAAPPTRTVPKVEESEDQVLDEAFKLAEKERKALPKPEVVEKTSEEDLPSKRVPQQGPWDDDTRTQKWKRNLNADGRAESSKAGMLENEKVVQLARTREAEHSPLRFKLDTDIAKDMQDDYQRLKGKDKHLN